MEIDTCHFEIHCHSLEAAEAFYVGTLGLPVLQRAPSAKLLAVRAGAVRLSVFYDATIDEIRRARQSGARIIFRTAALSEFIGRLQAAGVVVPAISEAPGFMKFISLEDPSGNRIEVAEYLRDPLAAA